MYDDYQRKVDAVNDADGGATALMVVGGAVGWLVAAVLAAVLLFG